MHLSISLILITFLSGCAAVTGTNQNIKNHLLLSPGMNKQQVIEKMGGQPMKAEFSRSVEEWHFCNTGYGEDEFVAVFFADGEVIAMKPYTVTISDTRGATGSCEKFVKMGNYREPDSVREYRLR